MKNNNEKIIKYLLEKNVDINEVDNNDVTALHPASLNNNITIVKYLLENKANIEQKDKNGRTALHIAIQNGNNEFSPSYL